MWWQIAILPNKFLFITNLHKEAYWLDDRIVLMIGIDYAN